MADDKLNLETLTIDEMLDLKDALEVKLTEIAKTETALMAERLTRLKAYIPEEKPAPDPATKSAKTKTTRRKPVRRAPKSEAKPKASPKAETAPKPKTKAASKPKPKRTRKTTRTSKVSAKFRDPETGKTWSGRGMAPVWLRDAEKAGRNRSEFAIQQG